MFNDNEKPKGLPRLSGLWYLIAGIVIGIFGVLGVMFFLTMPSGSAMPLPTPTFTLPYIPTPVPGATGTSPAHPVEVSAISPYRLRAFQVDADRGLVGLSYTHGSESILEVNTWPPSLATTPKMILSQGQPLYKRIGFTESPFSLLAASGSNYAFYDDAFALLSAIPSPSLLSQDIDSDDGAWRATIEGRILSIGSSTGATIMGTVQLKGTAYTGIFNHTGDELAIVTSDDEDAGEFRLTIYTIPKLHPTFEYNFEGTLAAPVVFSADDAYLAMAARDQMYIVPRESGGMKTFQIARAEQHSLAFESQNAWIAVGGGNPDVGETSVVIVYTLNEDASQSSDTPLTEIVLNDEIIGLQYTNTLLIGHRTGIDRVNVQLDPPWTTTPLLSASEEGFIPAQ